MRLNNTVDEVKKAKQIVLSLDNEGATLNKIAESLNKIGIRTFRGKKIGTSSASLFRTSVCGLPRRMLKQKKASKVADSKKIIETIAVSKLSIVKKMLKSNVFTDNEIEFILGI